MFTKYEKKISDFLENDSYVLDYKKKKENNELTNQDKIEYVKYLALKTVELTTMIDQGLL